MQIDPSWQLALALVLLVALGAVVARLARLKISRPIVVAALRAAVQLAAVSTIIVLAILWGFTTLTESTPVWILVVTQTVLSIGLAMSFTPLFTA